MRGDRFQVGGALPAAIGVAIAVGAGVVFAPLIIGSMLVAVGLAMRSPHAEHADVHSHVCDACGNAWTHCGRTSAGLESPHTCQRCGAVQWWRPGEREAMFHGRTADGLGDGRTMDGQ